MHLNLSGTMKIETKANKLYESYQIGVIYSELTILQTKVCRYCARRSLYVEQHANREIKSLALQFIKNKI